MDPPALESTLPPLPRRVADDEGADQAVGDPRGFVEDLLERTSHLLATLEDDVAGLRADQEEEQRRIEAEWHERNATAESFAEQVELLLLGARRMAEHKARTLDLEQGLADAVDVDPALVDDHTGPDAFRALVAGIEYEMKLARGITGAIRLRPIGRMLRQAALAAQAARAHADATRSRLISDTDQHLDAEGREARASFDIGLGVLRRDLALLDEVLPVEALPFDDARWDEWAPRTVPQPVVRVGGLVHDRLPHTRIPALFDLTTQGGITLDAGGDRAAAVAAVRAVLLRVLAAFPPGGVRFTFIDPTGLGDSVAPFLALGEYHPDLVDGGAASLDEDIERRLTNLTRHVESVIQRHLGGRHPTLLDSCLAAGEVVEPFRVVVAFDHPHGLTDRSVELLRALTETGARAGVHTIVVRTAADARRSRLTRAPARTTGAPPEGILAVGRDQSGPVVDVPRAGRWAIRLDQPPDLTFGGDDAGLFERIVTTVGEQARRRGLEPVRVARVYEALSEARRRKLRDDLPDTAGPVDPGDPSTWWTGDATRGIGVPIGRTPTRELATLWFDSSTRTGGLLAGRPGTGLTSLLHGTVTGLATIYPPHELQLVLVGFAGRRDFAPYGEHLLPSARVIASDAEPELATGVLELLTRELDRRITLFDDAGDARSGYPGYRAGNDRPLPRVLAVLDGIDRVLRGGDRTVDRTRRLLERVVEEGPTFGIHLLWVAVTDDDPTSLAAVVPGRLRSRVVLSPTEDEATALLGPGTSVDDDLGAGDALVVGGLGDEAARRVRVAWAEPNERVMARRDLRRLAEQRGVTRTPQVVDGGETARLEVAPLAQLAGDARRAEGRRSPRLWVGAPVGLGGPVEVRLRREEGGNLLVVSDDDRLGTGIVIGALTSALVDQGPDLTASVLDLSPPESGFGDRVGALAPLGQVDLARRRLLPKVLDRVHRAIQDRLTADITDAPPVLLVVHGLGRARDLDVGRAGPAGPGDLDLSALLETILHDGPEVGVHTIAWCDSVAAFERRLPRRALSDFALRIVAAVDEDDSDLLVDGSAAVGLRDTQAVLFDEERGRLRTFRPYGPAEPDWLRGLDATQPGREPGREPGRK